LRSNLLNPGAEYGVALNPFIDSNYIAINLAEEEWKAGINQPTLARYNASQISGKFLSGN
jgi:hypothetical protein